MIDLDRFGGNFSNNENRLIGEAVRRATAARFNNGVNRDTIVAAVVAEAARGTRNLFGLVKAGTRPAG